MFCFVFVFFSIVPHTLSCNNWLLFFQDIGRDTRETKMHYSPSEKDGVFVVECSRGADTEGGQAITNNQEKLQKAQQKLEDSTLNAQFKLNNPDGVAANQPQEVQIHQPPHGHGDDEILHIDENGAVSMTSPRSFNYATGQPYQPTNTGLSQSDLSISSSSGSNQGYSYGSLEPYTLDTRDYMEPSVPRTSHSIDACWFKEEDEDAINEQIDQNNKCNERTEESSTKAVPEEPQDDPDKPVITAAIYKNDTTEPLSLDEVKKDDGLPCRLMSDIQAEETRTEEKLLDEQRKLGNGTVPVEQLNVEPMVEVIQQVVDDIDQTETSSINSVIETDPNHIQENGDCTFDSLAYLPDPPPSDDITNLIEIDGIDNNNMDSLPPPPPPEIIVETQNGNIES